MLGFGVCIQGFQQASRLRFVDGRESMLGQSARLLEGTAE